MVRKRRTTTSKSQPQLSIEDRIIDVADIPVELKLLVYGRSGTGKTHILGTFPKPLLVLDVRDKGTTTIRNRPDTKVFPVTCWQDVEDIYWYLVNNPKMFKSVGCDTVTQLQDMAIRSIIGDNPGVISRRSWGESAGLLKTWILNYRDLPMNVCFTAQDRDNSSSDDFDDEGTLIPEVGPYVMPSVAKILNAAFGLIGQTFIREVEKKVKVGGKLKTKTVAEFCMRIGPHARYTTKFRRDPSMKGPSIPSIIVDPSYDKLLKYSIEGGN